MVISRVTLSGTSVGPSVGWTLKGDIKGDKILKSISLVEEGEPCPKRAFFLDMQ